jgi:hypothetical protein
MPPTRQPPRLNGPPLLIPNTRNHQNPHPHPQLANFSPRDATPPGFGWTNPSPAMNEMQMRREHDFELPFRESPFREPPFREPSFREPAFREQSMPGMRQQQGPPPPHGPPLSHGPMPPHGPPTHHGGPPTPHGPLPPHTRPSFPSSAPGRPMHDFGRPGSGMFDGAPAFNGAGPRGIDFPGPPGPSAFPPPPGPGMFPPPLDMGIYPPPMPAMPPPPFAHMQADDAPYSPITSLGSGSGAFSQSPSTHHMPPSPDGMPPIQRQPRQTQMGGSRGKGLVIFLLLDTDVYSNRPSTSPPGPAEPRPRPFLSPALRLSRVAFCKRTEAQGIPVLVPRWRPLRAGAAACVSAPHRTATRAAARLPLGDARARPRRQYGRRGAHATADR